MRRGAYTLGHKSVYWIIAAFFLAVIFLYSFYMYAHYQEGSLECTGAVVNEMMVAKVLYASDCFVAYDTELARALPGVIDMEKFTQENYNSCFKYLDKNMQLTIGEKTIGEEVEHPVTIHKPVLLSDGTPATLNIEVEASTC